MELSEKGICIFCLDLSFPVSVKVHLTLITDNCKFVNDKMIAIFFSVLEADVIKRITLGDGEEYEYQIDVKDVFKVCHFINFLHLSKER